MPPPDFSAKTIDTLAKRAGFLCSNPDCRVRTVGPNTDPDKSTTIGEAAHIQGARPGAERYDPKMSDVTRSAITNGLWLCRNCHKQIDRDADEYPIALLFMWRAEHEKHVALELGTPGDRIRYETRLVDLDPFSAFTPIVQRIVTDKPDGWEWRLAAELLRHFNDPLFRRLNDLRVGHVFKARERVGDDEVLCWLDDRTDTMSNVIPPFVALLDRLTQSFGGPGEPGDADEIRHTCLLMRDMLKEVVKHEEKLLFANLPEEAEELRSLLVDAVAQPIEQLREIPETLDQMVALIGTDHGGTVENPKVVTKTIVIELPDWWEDRMNVALKRFERHLHTQ